MTGYLTVAHSTFNWLPLTENWIHRQIEWQRKYRNVILATRLTKSYPDSDDLFAAANLSVVPWVANTVFRKLIHKDLFRDKVLSRYKNVLLHSHFGPMGWEDIHLRNKKWHITRFYGYDINKLPNTQKVWRKRYKELFDKCDAFLVEGPFMKQSLVNRGCPHEKVYVHQLGTDVEKIPFKNREITGRLKILMAGRFTEKKGMVYALEGIAMAYNDLNCREILVTIIGDSDGSQEQEYYKNSMMEVIRRNGIENIVKFTGSKKYGELLEMSLEHNIFLHPSVTAADGDCEGGYPVVLLDMMATGMPVVSTKHCDIPVVVPDVRFGTLCKERDSEEIAQVLSSIAGGNISFDSRTISAAVRNRFSWNERGEELVKIYDEVCNARI